MTSSALAVGCFLLAFSPSLSFLFLVAYSKAPLIIVVTISAFAYLLSSLVSSLLWFPFRKWLDSPLPAAAFIIPTSVVVQAIFRCGFVALYLKVENVIQTSIERHKRTESTTATDEGSVRNHGNNYLISSTIDTLSETDKLRLEINDKACALSAGIGFGGMHAVMLYGTLLASELRQHGTLYQPSCSFMPSIINSAMMAFFFSWLDIAWMIITFYGLRRLREDARMNYSWNFTPPVGGKAALTLVVALHSLASCVTLINNFRDDGCIVSLPLLGILVVLSIGFVWIFLWDNVSVGNGGRTRNV